MQKLAKQIDLFTLKLGRFASYLILPMVLLTFTVVVLRYGFGLGRVWLQELIIYIHATFFILGISYTALNNAHVRVDVFHPYFSVKKKCLVEILGTIFFIWPMLGFIFFKSLPYVYQSFKVFESSPDAGGLPGRFILKSLIPTLCFLVFIQSISTVLKNFLLYQTMKKKI